MGLSTFSFSSERKCKKLRNNKRKDTKKVSQQGKQILHWQKYKLVDFLYSDVQIPVNSKTTIWSCHVGLKLQSDNIETAVYKMVANVRFFL